MPRDIDEAIREAEVERDLQIMRAVMGLIPTHDLIAADDHLAALRAAKARGETTVPGEKE